MPPPIFYIGGFFMVVKLATFSKRENSTKQFNGTWVEKTCYLKENCSIINPSIELMRDATLINYNYAYIPDFNRYYFIDDTIIDAECIHLILRCDVLASFKTAIGSSSEYILRAASDYDGDVIDNLYPTKADCVFDIGSSVGAFDENNITYVVGILNNTSGNKVGVTKYYAMDSGELNSLITFLFGNNPNDYIDNMSTFITGMTVEFQNAIIRSLANPSQFIVESYALPYKPDVDSSETLTIGYLPSYCSGNPIKSGTLQKKVIPSTISLTLPSHPLAATRGHYLSSAPFTRYWLDLGVFGLYPLDASIAINYPSVDLSVTGDMFGNVRCTISLGAHIIDVLHANVKCNFPIAQVSYDVLGAATGVISSLATGQTSVDADDASALSGAVIGGVAKGASGILSGLKTLMPQVQRQGNQGTFLNAFTNFTSRAAFFMPVDEDNAHRGRPLCEVRQISSLSGYILVADSDIAIAGTKEENQQIKNYMNAGFYYE